MLNITSHDFLENTLVILIVGMIILALHLQDPRGPDDDDDDLTDGWP